MEKTMKVKGMGLLALDNFVRSNFPDRYSEWISTLSPEARKVYSHSVLASDLYPLHDTLVEPTQKVCDLFYGGDDRGASETGKHSASFALKGIYKIFFKIGSTKYIIDRAPRVFSSYYPDGELRIAESVSNRCVLHIVKFPEPYRLLEIVIAAWILGTLELLGCRNNKVLITKSLAKGDAVTEFTATWE
jgi:hypothetical protein